MPRRGRFIVFEGGEGTGKSTQARLLAQALTASGLDVLLTREPGGAPGADILRRLLLESPPEQGWTPLSEALLHYAARSEHLHKLILPALEAGRWVICDRFADSTAAYQGAGLAVSADCLAALRRLVVGATEPDLTIVLDLDTGIALRRAALRSPHPDRYEQMDADFHQRVRHAFLAFAREQPHRYVVIDAAAEIHAVADAVASAVGDRLHVHPDLRFPFR